MKKKKKIAPRNSSALPAKMRKGAGPHKNKSEKRKDEDKRYEKYLED